jgi:hypothetical protein
MSGDFIGGMFIGWALNLLVVIPVLLFAMKRVES